MDLHLGLADTESAAIPERGYGHPKVSIRHNGVWDDQSDKALKVSVDSPDNKPFTGKENPACPDKEPHNDGHQKCSYLS